MVRFVQWKETRAVIVGRFSLTHCSSSHSRGSTFPQRHIRSSPMQFYLRTCTKNVAQHRSAPPDMIQHAGSERGASVCVCVSCALPRGLGSCRYGGAVGVTLSVLGPDNSGDRSSMPSEEAMLSWGRVRANQSRRQRRRWLSWTGFFPSATESSQQRRRVRSSQLLRSGSACDGKPGRRSSAPGFGGLCCPSPQRKKHGPG